ncbi:hypothetical protein NG791_01670 [Laspinema sp. D1]|uniref:hypothetical protein n=1 Tax=Laspinema palackyanum TaxID=3231601 RepID=UPI00348A610B|nr:hypothetical protein [Laspinema sp. D2b]
MHSFVLTLARTDLGNDLSRGRPLGTRHPHCAILFGGKRFSTPAISAIETWLEEILETGFLPETWDKMTTVPPNPVFEILIYSFNNP